MKRDSTFVSTWGIKRSYDDFIVDEVLYPALSGGRDTPASTRITLSKSGLTTLESARLIALAAAVDLGDIDWAGLKDEDGVTRQTLSVRGVYTAEQVSAWSEKLAVSLPTGTHARLTFAGYADAPLTPGALLGNAFSVVVRNLAPSHLPLIGQLTRRPFAFINYYDLQRFGRKDEQKLNHLIGAALIEGDREFAASLYARKVRRGEVSGIDEPSASLDRLAPQEEILIRNAHESHAWNRLAMSACESSMGTLDKETFEHGLAFGYFDDEQAEASGLVTRTLAIRRHRLRDRVPSTSESTRQIIDTTLIRCLEEKVDAQTGTASVALSFFLPSGSYATTVIRQLEHRVLTTAGQLTAQAEAAQ